MLGKTAGSLFWMLRYLERAENISRLIDAGFRIALTRSEDAADEWESVLKATAAAQSYTQCHDVIDTKNVVDFLLRSPKNASSVYSCFKAARENGRNARTALTREMWEAVNEGWMRLDVDLKNPVSTKDLPAVLSLVRQQCSLVRGAMQGTMLRNDCYDFAQLGIFIERADCTARLLDVKYYILLPSVNLVGSSIDNAQWETILRSVSAERAFHWLYPGNIKAPDIAEFLILDRRMPRSLAFCAREVTHSLDYIRGAYKTSPPSYEMAYDLRALVEQININQIFNIGLHEFVTNFLSATAALAGQIATDYRFTV
ncbi:MAG: alpha-E domain-containing protein [Hellea sp.]|nr:alpha-E domain-containing protein [Hellea sp.]